ncbi:putative prophage repressor protein [Burkholderia phage BcepC6B]|uniref:Putative prophage repressor protein n=1 Tax=Burkholderia phage BcepC6B TaxID=2883949 RepID=Q6J1N3_9CAUD|nr:transcriptional regulator [Burkholderia phage BcepC6B]AAT38403.1 putative prophage repressor protein [Burkholderia phage BcepC6B]
MTEAQHIGTRIRELRKAKGLTLQQLADVFGISRASVSEWESGRSKPDANKLVLLAKELHTAVEYLLNGDTNDAMSFADSAASRRRLRGGTKQSASIVDNSESNITEWPVGKLPLISWVQAGDWSEIVDNFQPGDAEDWIACPFPSGSHGFVLRVVGDSMYNPSGDMSFREGDFISVNPDREAQHRSLVIARHNGEKATFKQLLIDENDGPMLFALNPNWPKRYIALDKDTEIIGVVTGQWRPLV